MPLDTERKLNGHKTFKRHPGCLFNVLYTSVYFKSDRQDIHQITLNICFIFDKKLQF